MQFAKILFSLGVVGAGAKSIGSPRVQAGAASALDPLVGVIDLPISDHDSEERRALSHSQTNRRSEIHCHLKNWESASVDSIKEAYSWFYSLVAPMDVSAQHCHRIACFGTSGVWLCADDLAAQTVNSVPIADLKHRVEKGCLKFAWLLIGPVTLLPQSLIPPTGTRSMVGERFDTSSTNTPEVDCGQGAIQIFVTALELLSSDVDTRKEKPFPGLKE
ncbi:hypothetical protein NUW58_g4741 [Xylaria curta]|uniref:Uncharacterized protein n=1 Tax=Xylaria curta TaxID=42375 RepID=A0ACC1P5U8_9PEZI|nr:hypothetical protein NUW58_g4741 [Xylaria curta]